MELIQFVNGFKLNTETMKYYCAIGFYTLLAFQRHKVCNFWIYGLKDINFTSFSNLKQYKNRFEFRASLGADTWHDLWIRVRTSLVGSGSETVGFKLDRAIQISPYRFGE
jgi:hypothetical protein